MLDAEGNDIIMLVEKGAIYTYMIPPILLWPHKFGLFLLLSIVKNVKI
jgi:hypothetical protein